MTTFLDTSGIYALLDRNDRCHTVASAAFPELLAGSGGLLTHGYVLLETTALAQARLGLDAVRAVRDDITPALRVLWVDESLHAAALTGLVAAARREVSLVDRVSFEVMRRLGLRRAFAFDRRFAAEGFELLPQG